LAPLCGSGEGNGYSQDRLPGSSQWKIVQGKRTWRLAKARPVSARSRRLLSAAPDSAPAISVRHSGGLSWKLREKARNRQSGA